MPVKGNGYLKTTWNYQERPVSSTKLNQWDDRIEAALELVHYLLNLAWGGGNGVLRGATSHDLGVKATVPAGMTVEVRPGYAFISRFPYKLGQTAESPVVAAPSTEARIDLVQARLLTWDIAIKSGDEALAPVAPAPDPDCIALAHLYCRPGMTRIADGDDTLNGYIIDAREFV